MKRKEYIEKLLPLTKEVYPMACRLLQDDILAEDVVQDVMMGLWKRRRDIQIRSNYKSFLYQSVRNKCLDFLRKRKSCDFNSLDMVVEPTIQSKKEFDTMTWIQHCINTLPRMQQQVICMREIDGLEFKEISEILGETEANVRMLLSRAKKELRKMIQDKL